MKKKIIISGSTGLIGQSLGTFLIDKGFEVVGLSRNPERHTVDNKSFSRLVHWDASVAYGKWKQEIDGAYAVINLAGENIASGYWTKRKRQKILKSRLKSIYALQDAIFLAEKKPEYFIQASATGFYGKKRVETVNEKAPSGDGFLAKVCRHVEKDVLRTENTKVIITRFGVVLDRRGGALSRMIKPLKFGICGIPGSGKNNVSWIHTEDLIRSIFHLLNHQQDSGIFNITSPAPVTLKKILKTSASIKSMAICFPIPKAVLRLIYGRDMVDETILADQSVIPEELINSGFTFSYPNIKDALIEILT